MSVSGTRSFFCLKPKELARFDVYHHYLLIMSISDLISAKYYFTPTVAFTSWPAMRLRLDGEG